MKNLSVAISFSIGVVVGALLLHFSQPKPIDTTLENFYRGYYESCLESRPLKDQDLTANANFCLVLTRAAYDAKVDDITDNGYQWPLPVFPTADPTAKSQASSVKVFKPGASSSETVYTIYLPFVASPCSWNYIAWIWTQPVSGFLHDDVLNCYHLLYPFDPVDGRYEDDNGNPAPLLCPPPAPNPWREVFNSSNCQ